MKRARKKGQRGVRFKRWSTRDDRSLPILDMNVPYLEVKPLVEQRVDNMKDAPVGSLKLLQATCDMLGVGFDPSMNFKLPPNQFYSNTRLFFNTDRTLWMLVREVPRTGVFHKSLTYSSKETALFAYSSGVHWDPHPFKLFEPIPR